MENRNPPPLTGPCPWNRILRPIKQEKPRNGPRNRLFKPETRFPCPAGNENGIFIPKSSKNRQTGMKNAVSFPNQPERQFFSGTFSAPEGPQRACRGITNPPQAHLSACKAISAPDRNRRRGKSTELWGNVNLIMSKHADFTTISRPEKRKGAYISVSALV